MCIVHIAATLCRALSGKAAYESTSFYPKSPTVDSMSVTVYAMQSRIQEGRPKLPEPWQYTVGQD